jgi:hypothetical protein
MSTAYLEAGRTASALIVNCSATAETVNRAASVEEVLPEGLALLLAGIVLCRTATGASRPPHDSAERSWLAFASSAGLTPKSLLAAFPPVRVMPDRSASRTSIICRLPERLGSMPLSIRRVWKGALSTDGANLVVFTAGEARGMIGASHGVIVGGQVYPLEGAWRGLMDGAAGRLSERGGALGVALRFIDERLLGAERSVIESRLMLAGLAGSRESSGEAECMRDARNDPRRIHLTRTELGDPGMACASVALTADCACSLY